MTISHETVPINSLLRTRQAPILIQVMGNSITAMKLHQLVSIFPALLIPQLSQSDTELAIESGFQSELEAVKAAADLYNPLSIKQDREYLGVILKLGADFGYTVIGGGKSADSLTLSIDRETWSNTVALWHTHGNENSTHRYFSDKDTRTAIRLNKPFYLADYTGYLKIFRSGDAMLSPFLARRLGLNYRSGYAIGNHVLDRFERPIRVKTRS